MTGRLKRKKKDIDCKIKKGNFYNLEVNAITKGNMSRRDINLRTNYKGKCIFRNKNIAVFDNGLYRTAMSVNTFGIDWQIKE